MVRKNPMVIYHFEMKLEKVKLGRHIPKQYYQAIGEVQEPYEFQLWNFSFMELKRKDFFSSLFTAERGISFINIEV
jgi:hypothetical protein